MSVSSTQLGRQLGERVAAIDTEMGALHGLQRTISADRARQDEAHELAWSHLADVLVADLTPTTLDGVAARIRLPAVTATAVAARRHSTLAQAANRRAALLADDRIQRSAELENEWQIRLAEVDEAIVPLAESTTSLETAPLFMELLAYRYGTDEYAVRFWQLSYYKHWKHGDLIVEAFGSRFGLDTFKAIAARYVDEKAALDELQSVRAAFVARRDELARLKAQLLEVDTTITDIDAIVLRATRTRVRDHLKPLDDNTMQGLLVGDDTGALAWKRIVGLGRKRAYLTSLEDEQVRANLKQLDIMKSKFNRNRAKVGRHKNASRRWSDDEANRMLGPERHEQWNKRRHRIDEARTHIVTFEHYDRWSPAQDVLWWDLMTDGRVDGSFIPEVRARGPRTHQRLSAVGSHQSDARADRDFDIS